MTALHTPDKPESQKTIMGLMGSKGSNMQIESDHRKKEGAQNGCCITLGTGGHADNQSTKNERQITGVLQNIAKPDNRQRAHQAKGRDNAVADDGHYHRDNDRK